MKEEAKINRWSVSAHKCDSKLTRDQKKKKIRVTVKKPHPQ